MQSDIKYKEWKLGILAIPKAISVRVTGHSIAKKLKNIKTPNDDWLLPVDRLITRNIGMKVDNGHGGYENSSFSLHRRTMGLE